MQEFDNSKTRISKYTQDPELIKEFIKNNIDYSSLPSLDKTIKVIVGVHNANEDGKIDNVTILLGFNDIFDKEALRIVKSIPQWDVLYRHGEKIRGASWMIPVIFEWGGKN
jgi:ethanolamine utilization protein EutP (predicted NTPase)